MRRRGSRARLLARGRPRLQPEHELEREEGVVLDAADELEERPRLVERARDGGLLELGLVGAQLRARELLEGVGALRGQQLARRDEGVAHQPAGHDGPLRPVAAPAERSARRREARHVAHAHPANLGPVRHLEGGEAREQDRDVVAGDVVPHEHVRVELVQPRDQEVEQPALVTHHLEPHLVLLDCARQVPRPRLVELAHDGEGGEGGRVGGRAVGGDAAVRDDRRERDLGLVLGVEDGLHVQRRHDERRRRRRVAPHGDALLALGKRNLVLGPRGGGGGRRHAAQGEPARAGDAALEEQQLEARGASAYPQRARGRVVVVEEGGVCGGRPLAPKTREKVSPTASAGRAGYSPE